MTLPCFAVERGAVMGSTMPLSVRPSRAIRPLWLVRGGLWTVWAILCPYLAFLKDLILAKSRSTSSGEA